MKKSVIAAAIAALSVGLGISGQSNAATATSTFSVSLTIQGECQVQSASNLAFGSYGIIAGNIDSTSSVGVQCTSATPYTVALSAGAGSGATVSSRKMTSAANDTVNYAIYRDSSRSQVWGATQGVDTQAGTGNGSVQTFTAYGRVAAQTTPGQGSYSDLVSVTITY